MIRQTNSYKIYYNYSMIIARVYAIFGSIHRRLMQQMVKWNGNQNIRRMGVLNVANVSLMNYYKQNLGMYLKLFFFNQGDFVTS